MLFRGAGTSDINAGEGAKRMPISNCRWFKRAAEFLPRTAISQLPTRALQVGCVRMRAANRRRGLWTHFSVFEVWDNVWEQEVAELEGIFATSTVAIDRPIVSMFRDRSSH